MNKEIHKKQTRNSTSPRIRLITLEERKLIEKYLKEGYPPYMIAKFLGRGRNVIVNEIKRNSVNGVYNAEIAHKLSIERSKNRFYKRHPEYRRPGDVLVDDELLIKTFYPYKVKLNSYAIKLLKRYAQRIFLERVENLKNIFGNDNWKKASSLLLHDPNKLKQKAEKISKVLGDLWKEFPYLLTRNENKLIKRWLLLKKLFHCDERAILVKTPLFMMPTEKLLFVYRQAKIENPDVVYDPNIFISVYKKLKKRGFLTFPSKDVLKK